MNIGFRLNRQDVKMNITQWHPKSDAVHWYMQELSSRVVAQSGIPTDRHHLGKLILQCFKDAPDFVLQVNTHSIE